MFMTTGVNQASRELSDTIALEKNVSARNSSTGGCHFSIVTEPSASDVIL